MLTLLFVLISKISKRGTPVVLLGKWAKGRTQAGQSLQYNFLSKWEGVWSRPIFHISRITHLAFFHHPGAVLVR
jgi:hypothetical protein